MLDFQDIFQQLGYSITDTDNSNAKRITLQYITNRDGSIRWIWPSGMKEPLFLRFYNVQGWKANLYSQLIHLIFYWAISNWVFKKISFSVMPSKEDCSFDIFNFGWSLFTGTVGPNQKYLFYQEKEPEGGTFTKIGLSPNSTSLIKNEACILQQLSQSKITSFRWPESQVQIDNKLSLSENKQFNNRNNQVTGQHIRLIHSLENHNSQDITFEAFDHIHQITNRIEQLSTNRNKVPAGIIKKLVQLCQSFQGTTLTTHWAHGDFTPWNMLSDKEGELYVYDWELSGYHFPKAFDFFHFIMQNGILVQKKSWSEIKQEIKKSGNSLMRENEIDQYLSLYLLVNTLNYLEIYEHQNRWHEQVYWLLKTWNMALSDILSTATNQRELIILDIFDFISHSEYAGLKLGAQPEKLSVYSDLDMLMNKADARLLSGFLKVHPLVLKLQVLKGFAMTKMVLLTKTHEILSLDAIHQLKRNHLQYMSVQEIIQRPDIDKDGIKRVNHRDTLTFLGWFYGLNHAGIPDKFKHFQADLSAVEPALNHVILAQFSEKRPAHAVLAKEAKTMACNRGLAGMLNLITWYLDRLLEAFNKKGMIITFSGVDGAGKSTVISQTKQELEKKMRRNVVVIRHRPSVLPILSAYTMGKEKAEQKAGSTLPRQGNNKSLVSSLLRFAYYYTDYLFGQFYVYIRYVLRGDIVLYDRYYFDFIHDSLRSNILLPKWFTKAGYALLIPARLNFFLYADVRTILGRKQELDAEAITELTRNYLDLFRELDHKAAGKYYPVENIHLQETLHFILSKAKAQLV